jgi:hypothetical protein
MNPGFKTKDMRNEADVKENVRRVFALMQTMYPNKLWYFMPPANGYGRSGIPDFVGTLRDSAGVGRSFAIETKFGSNTPTAHQLNEIEGMTQAGARVWIVRETSFSAFMAEFTAWCALCS